MFENKSKIENRNIFQTEEAKIQVMSKLLSQKKR